MTVRDAELMTVGPDDAVVTFLTDDDIAVEAALHVAGSVSAEVRSTDGPVHVVRFDDLQPGTTYELHVAGVEADDWLPQSFTTLEQPSGRLLATVATANDVHFGELECGRVGDVLENEIGPVLRSEPGEAPYPEVMNGAVIDEMLALDPDAVVV